MDSELKEILEDFPPGPLSEYRKQASFNWKDMAVLIQGKGGLILKVNGFFFKQLLVCTYS